MAILSFFIQLAGATMLLLYAVAMVRTGIERSFGASFQRMLTRQSNLAGAAVAGIGLAVVLQSSAAVALLVAGFSGGGVLGFNTGLAIVLGGDLGSALIIQVLSFRLDWLIPLLLVVGGWLFLKSGNRRFRQYGRIFMGIAFILISLQFLRQAMDPIRESSFLPTVADYLARDYLTAFIVGAALAFTMHSSVAAVLMVVTLVAISAIPLEAGISLVFGANLGSATIPIWLTRGMSLSARKVPFANLALRGCWALAVLFLINLFNPLDYFPSVGPQQKVIYTHLAFNLSLLLLALPFTGLIARLTEVLMPESVASTVADINAPASALDRHIIDTPHLALASIRREVLRMAAIVERMATPVMDVFETGDLERIKELRDLDAQVNDALSGIRSYVADMAATGSAKSDLKAARELAEFAISLESAGDIIAKRLLPLASDKAKKRKKFSPEGWAELRSIHERVMANMRLASSVLVQSDPECARLLAAGKTEITRLERKSRKKHLKRLAEGGTRSFDTSNLHLETLRGLADFNNQISVIAYPILYRTGQLLETRLIENIEKDGLPN